MSGYEKVEKQCVTCTKPHKLTLLILAAIIIVVAGLMIKKSIKTVCPLVQAEVRPNGICHVDISG